MQVISQQDKNMNFDIFLATDIYLSKFIILEI